MSATDNYQTGSMNLVEAIDLVNQAKKSRIMIFPANYDDLKEVCKTIHTLMVAHDLMNTAFYEEMEKKIHNFDVDPRDLSFMQMNFEQMITIIETHARLISEKFKLGYP